MNLFEQELEALSAQENDVEEALPTLEQQKQIVAELKSLEAKGELTPEVLEEYFGKFYAKTDAPVH